MQSSPGPGRVSDEFHAINVERTLRELQRMVREHEDALSKLKDTALPHGYSYRQQSALSSLEVMAEAYERVTETEPFLPFQNSVLPALLALRKTHATITESKSFSQFQETSIEKARRRLEAEESNLSDQKALQAALKKRIQSLRHDVETRRDLNPDQLRKEQLEKLKQQKCKYDRETSKLLQDLNAFIDDHLGAMLAAEDLGGPVVGDAMEIDSDGLEVGFNAQGKPRKPKREANPDKRQQRIDIIWGDQQAGHNQAKSGKRERDEASAAGAELRDLIEELLNNLMQSAGDTSAAYVKIPRESAAARFLVRSKIAQFHPKDATRLRLLDFGQELDD